ncbi:hypothetical protein DASC09_030480 [Saccharomycopsis crataegensis]|uniref:GH26 domain-containing protein n=1 Tax=Saccharomycopsis crataegensis TaxID=43959 RepID=A0AAV5QLR5_9ASCO|nr:hypothetical protein DASC09_030480 [Saccharomycopsis crataegensis]
MKFIETLALGALTLAISANGAPLASQDWALKKRNAASLTLPANCLKQNNIGVGWLPDDDNGYISIDTITNTTGPACFYGLYSHFGADLSVSNSDILGDKLSDVKNSGAIAVLSMMPFSVSLSGVTTEVAAQVALVVKEYTDQGITVLLRFAHEFNYYTTSGMFHGTSTDFKTAWINIYNAVKSNPKVKMFWSPNNTQNTGSLAEWWPGDDTVDVVGIDAYKTQSTDTFDSFYQEFYQAYSASKNLPFVIAETGTINDSYKAEWLKELASQSQSKYSNYVGFSWFEYNKPSEGDFRVVTGPIDYAKQVLTGMGNNKAASTKSYSTESASHSPTATVGGNQGAKSTAATSQTTTETPPNSTATALKSIKDSISSMQNALESIQSSIAKLESK